MLVLETGNKQINKEAYNGGGKSIEEKLSRVKDQRMTEAAILIRPLWGNAI